MSKPRSPYYYKEFGTTYHWEIECPRNNFPALDWVKGGVRPKDRQPCAYCLSK